MGVKLFYVIINIVICAHTIHAQDNTHEECSTPDGSPGHCIPIQACTYLANIYEPAPKPLSPSQVQNLHKYHCGFHGSSPTPKVCCPHTPPAAAPAPALGPPLQSQLSPEAPLHTSTIDKARLINQDNCGGKVQGLAKYPWMALLAYNTSNGIVFKCGGSLINENYILTAAQCLTPSLVAVRLGEYDTSTEIDCYPKKGCAPPVQDLAIAEAIQHGGYNTNTQEHDLGLIRLSRPANVQSETIKPICLPLQDELPSLVGKYADVTGWGATETGYSSTKLLRVSLPILSLPACQTLYSERKTSVVLGGSQMCAGGVRGRDACSGDGGGPLSVPDVSGVTVQHGVVSFGSRYCGTVGHSLPGVYTNVGRYVNWILDNIRP